MAAASVERQQAANGLDRGGGCSDCSGRVLRSRYYKKRTRSAESSAKHLNENSRVEPKSDEAERQAKAAARLAKARKLQEDLKSTNRTLLGTPAAYAAFLTVYHVASEE